MRISDWSSDVCSSDLAAQPLHQAEHAKHRTGAQRLRLPAADRGEQRMIERIALDAGLAPTVRATVSNLTNHTFLGKPTDLKSVVTGKSVSIRVTLGVRRTIKKCKRQNNIIHHKQT